MAASRAVDCTRQIAPSGAPTAHRLRGIRLGESFLVREYVPIQLRVRSKQQLGSPAQFQNRSPSVQIQRNGAFSRIRLGRTALHRNGALDEVHSLPAQAPDLTGS